MSDAFFTGHHAHVHHLAVDPSGCLLATCSSDKTVNILHRNLFPGAASPWVLACSLADHSGPVIRLAWCQHREHGPLLASVGADRWIYVYRVIISKQEESDTVRAIRWSLVRGYEKDVITDVAFIPPQQYHVLLLSTASLDGCVRLYEVNQRLQFACICKMSPEVDFPYREGVSGELRDVGISSLSWFPGASETTMTLAVGAVSGRVSLYRYLKDESSFSPLTSFPRVWCRSPVTQLTWAFPVGRNFQLLAVCSKTEIYIIRMNCISPSFCDDSVTFELFHYPCGASSVSWSNSSTLLYLVSDTAVKEVTVLQMSDPTDHKTWQPRDPVAVRQPTIGDTVLNRSYFLFLCSSTFDTQRLSHHNHYHKREKTG